MLMAETIDSCIDFIMRHFESTRQASPEVKTLQRSIFVLGIDELLKSYDSNLLAQELATPGHNFSKSQAFFNDFISAIGDLMELDGKSFAVLPVVTSLSQLTVAKTTTNSKRSINWIHLPPLEGIDKEVCRALNINATSHPDAVKAIEFLCDYLGLHGRLVELLTLILLEDRKLLDRLKEAGLPICSEIVDKLLGDVLAVDYAVRFSDSRIVFQLQLWYVSFSFRSVRLFRAGESQRGQCCMRRVWQRDGFS